MPRPISYTNYASMLVDADLVEELRHSKIGTRPVDIALIRKVVATKLADPKFQERFANEMFAKGALSTRAAR